MNTALRGALVCLLVGFALPTHAQQRPDRRQPLPVDHVHFVVRAGTGVTDLATFACASHLESRYRQTHVNTEATTCLSRSATEAGCRRRRGQPTPELIVRVEARHEDGFVYVSFEGRTPGARGSFRAESAVLSDDAATLARLGHDPDIASLTGDELTHAAVRMACTRLVNSSVMQL